MEQNSKPLVEGPGGQTLAAPKGPTNDEDDGKNFVQKTKRRLTEGEAEEWNALLKQKAPICEFDAGEAAYEDRCEEEECRELIGKFTHESAKRTGDGISEIVDCYETIVMEFLAARYAGKCLSSLLLGDYETEKALNKFLSDLGEWIKRHALRCIRGEPQYTWRLNGSDDVRAIETLRGHAVSERLMTALGVQYVNDRGGLMGFLEAVFKHWRKINLPDSLFRRRLLTHQLAGTPKEIANALQEIGVVAPCTTAEQIESLHAKIRQDRSRDRRKAFEKRQKGR
jgi:hypothetical protein